MRTPIKPKLKTVTRIQFRTHQASIIGRRQIRWILFSTITALLLGAMVPTLRFDLLLLLSLWAGMLTTCSWSKVEAFAALGLAFLVTEAISPIALTAWSPFPAWPHFTQGPTQTITGIQLMGSTAALGLGESWRDSNGTSVWSTRLQHGLGMALFVALGWVLCQTLWPNAVAVPLFYWASIISTCTSFTLWHALFKSVEVTRIPAKRVIRRELAEAYRPTCLQALQLDAEIAEECGDTESRDGLGEVAAWVYRLQWTLQRFDRELKCQNEIDIHTRLQQAQAYATETCDAYTKERHHATIHQLHRLKEHREKIAVERERALALVDFAMVNLQEARAQLVLAHLQPGTHPPPSVQDVLSRLRSWSQDRTAAHSSEHEMWQLS